MDYTSLLVNQFQFAKYAHELAKLLEQVQAIGGKIYAPKELAPKMQEFVETLELLRPYYESRECENIE